MIGLSEDDISRILWNTNRKDIAHSVAWVRREMAGQLEREKIIQQFLKSAFLDRLGSFDGPVDMILSYCDVIEEASRILI